MRRIAIAIAFAALALVALTGGVKRTDYLPKFHGIDLDTVGTAKQVRVGIQNSGGDSLLIHFLDSTDCGYIVYSRATERLYLQRCDGGALIALDSLAGGGGGTSDSVAVDTGAGTFTRWMYPSYIREGTNVTLSLQTDTLTISAPGGSGTSDSVGVDTGAGAFTRWLYPAWLREGTNTVFSIAGDTLTVTGPTPGTSDSILYDTGAGTFTRALYPAYLREGTNVTLSGAGDTLTISAPGGSGTSDSVGVDTGAGTFTRWVYPAYVREGTGITLSVTTDTLSISRTSDTTAKVLYDPGTISDSLKWGIDGTTTDTLTADGAGTIRVIIRSPDTLQVEADVVGKGTGAVIIGSDTLRADDSAASNLGISSKPWKNFYAWQMYVYKDSGSNDSWMPFPQAVPADGEGLVYRSAGDSLDWGAVSGTITAVYGSSVSGHVTEANDTVWIDTLDATGGSADSAVIAAIVRDSLSGTTGMNNRDIHNVSLLDADTIGDPTGAGGIKFSMVDSVRYVMDTNGWYPTDSDAYNLGTFALRWDTIYADKLYGSTAGSFGIYGDTGVGYTKFSDSIFIREGTGITMDRTAGDTLVITSSAAGETDSTGIAGVPDGSAGFGLVSDSTGTRKTIRQLKEGTNIELAYSGDTAVTITSTASGGETDTTGIAGVPNGTTGFGMVSDSLGTRKTIRQLTAGANITLAYSGDTAVTVTGAAGGSGTEDTVKFVLDTNSAVISSYDNEIRLKPGTGLDASFGGGNDTFYLSVDGTELSQIGTGTVLSVYADSVAVAEELRLAKALLSQAGDSILDFTGTNLSVTNGVLNASGSGGETDTLDGGNVWNGTSGFDMVSDSLGSRKAVRGLMEGTGIALGYSTGSDSGVTVAFDSTGVIVSRAIGSDSALHAEGADSALHAEGADSALHAEGADSALTAVTATLADSATRVDTAYLPFENYLPLAGGTMSSGADVDANGGRWTGYDYASADTVNGDRLTSDSAFFGNRGVAAEATNDNNVIFVSDSIDLRNNTDEKTGIYAAMVYTGDTTGILRGIYARTQPKSGVGDTIQRISSIQGLARKMNDGAVTYLEGVRAEATTEDANDNNLSFVNFMYGLNAVANVKDSTDVTGILASVAAGRPWVTPSRGSTAAIGVSLYGQQPVADSGITNDFALLLDRAKTTGEGAGTPVQIAFRDSASTFAMIQWDRRDSSLGATSYGRFEFSNPIHVTGPGEVTGRMTVGDAIVVDSVIPVVGTAGLVYFNADSVMSKTNTVLLGAKDADSSAATRNYARKVAGDSARALNMLDSIMVDSDGGAMDASYKGGFGLREGANVTFTMIGDTLTIAGPSASGTADSIGVDTDGDGDNDGYIYSSTAGAMSLKKGSNITLSLTNDTLTIASTGGSGDDTVAVLDADGGSALERPYVDMLNGGALADTLAILTDSTQALIWTDSTLALRGKQGTVVGDSTSATAFRVVLNSTPAMSIGSTGDVDVTVGSNQTLSVDSILLGGTLIGPNTYLPVTGGSISGDVDMTTGTNQTLSVDSILLGGSLIGPNTYPAATAVVLLTGTQAMTGDLDVTAGSNQTVSCDSILLGGTLIGPNTYLPLAGGSITGDVDMTAGSNQTLSVDSVLLGGRLVGPNDSTFAKVADASITGGAAAAGVKLAANTITTANINGESGTGAVATTVDPAFGVVLDIDSVGIDTLLVSTRLVAPNSASPDINGALSMDQTTEVLRSYEGAAYTLASRRKSKSFVMYTPAADMDFPIWKLPRAITVDSMYFICTGGTNVIGDLMEYGTDGTTPVTILGADSTFTTTQKLMTPPSNSVLDQYDWLGIKTTSVSGTVLGLSVTVFYHEQ